ncbi:MAG: class I SAM-dependent methyltransferase [Rhodothermaceae bacterium]
MSLYHSISHIYDDIFPLNEAKRGFFNEYFKKGNLNILDCGCANGKLAAFAESFGNKVIGIDLNSALLREAENLKNENLQFVNLDILSVDQVAEPESQDVITCIGNTLPHLANKESIEEFISKCASLLKPKGKLILQFVNFDGDTYDFPVIECDNFAFFREYIPDYFENKVEFNTRLILKNNGQMFSDQTYLFPVKFEQIKTMLDNQGLRLANKFSSFKRDVVNKHTKSYLLVIEK